MRLEDKGPIAAAPTLPRAAERVADAVRSWPGIVCVCHWQLFDRSVADGADFYVGERELGHLHLGGELHLATTRALRDALVQRRLARPSVWDPNGPWVESSVQRVRDVEHGIWLFRLNYDRLQGVKALALLDRVSQSEILAAPAG